MKKYGIKNRYCSSQKLHELVDRRSIYGNFAEGARSIKLVHGGVHLGDVPAENLKVMTKGNCVRFAGRCWRIAAKKIDRMELEPMPTVSTASDFQYGGTGIVQDAYLFERLWALIHTADIPFKLLSKPLSESAVKMVECYRDHSTHLTIPMSVTPGGFRYHTFAGRKINTAIALWTRQPFTRSEDTFVVLPERITWSDLPADPNAYVTLLDGLPAQSQDLTVFQQLLPASLLQHERHQSWLNDDTIRTVLKRLKSSVTVDLPSDV